METSQKRVKKFLIEIIETIVGAIIMAIATSLFLLPNQLSSGGFAGIATILYYFLDIPMGTTIFSPATLRKTRSFFNFITIISIFNNILCKNVIYQ